jgi:spore germination protein KC
VGVLLFFFFTNDFGLTDVQKTAIVMAVGVDRENDEFVVTSQIAVPSSGGNSKPVQIESRGATVAEAVSRINGKSGWYPKLVFCKLVLIGEEAAKKNVFDALDYFLRDEYLSDGCYVAVAEGTAKKVLDATTPIDSSSALAVQKVLSEHAERVGTVAPTTLRDFAKGYFGESKSGWTPIVKIEPKEEGGEATGVPSAQSDGQKGQSEQNDKTGGSQSQEEFTFSAAETALFSKGVMTGKLTPEETFAFQTATGKLRLASYTVKNGNENQSLLIKNNQPSVKLTVDKKAVPRLKISVTLTVPFTQHCFQPFPFGSFFVF